jgi:hypothetical protein
MRALLLFAILFCYLVAVEGGGKHCTVTRYKTLHPRTKTVTNILRPTVTAISTIVVVEPTVVRTTVSNVVTTTVPTSKIETSTVYDLPPVTTAGTPLALKKVKNSRLNPTFEFKKRSSLRFKNHKCKTVTRFVHKTRTVTQIITKPHVIKATTNTTSYKQTATTTITATNWMTTTSVSVIHPNHNFKGCSPSNLIHNGKARIEDSSHVFLQESTSVIECCASCYSKGNACTVWSHYGGDCYIATLQDPTKCLVAPPAKVNISIVDYHKFEVYQGNGPCAVVY